MVVAGTLETGPGLVGAVLAAVGAVGAAVGTSVLPRAYESYIPSSRLRWIRGLKPGSLGPPEIMSACMDVISSRSCLLGK